MKKHNTSPTKKSRGKKLLLSVVALVEILLLLVVSTYAWVETVSTIRIYTSNSAEAKVDATPTGQFLTHAFHRAAISTSATTDIDLSKMYHESGAFHLAPASSADGKTVFFPHIKTDPVTTDFRKADSSDNMVNYVSFSFKVAAAGYFVFDQDPTFSFGNSSNLVRVSLQVENGTPKIFSKAVDTSSVVSTIAGGKTATNVRKFSDYLSSGADYALHTTAANQIVTVRIWIQDPTHTNSATYTGQTLNITNLKLVTAYPVTTYVTLNKTAANSASHASAAAGTVQAGNAGASWKSVAYVKRNATVDLVATNADPSFYTFKGWGTSASATSYENSNLSYTTAAITGSTTRYACFTSKIAITATAVLGTTTTSSTTYGKVLVAASNSGTPTEATSTYNYDYGATIYLRSVAGSGYTFVGWYNGTGSGATYLSGDANYTISNAATAATTYYARYMKNPTITANAVLGSGTTPSATYGTVRVGTSGSYAATSSASVSYNGGTTLYATPASGYAVDCWYKGTPSSTNFVTDSNGAESISVSSITADTTYYCSFKKKSVVTLYFTLTSAEDNMTVYTWEDQFAHEFTGSWPGQKPTWDAATGLYSISFETVDTGTFHVQINGVNTKTYDGTITDGATYLLNNGTWSSSPTITGYRFFYYTNSNNWSGTIYCHNWVNGGASTTWPGTAMTQIYTNSNSQKVYQIRIASTRNRLIFNNNSSQTGNITTSTSYCRYWGGGTDSERW